MKNKSMPRLYYTPPPDKIFKEVKEKCIEIWNTYDNTYGYVDEKVDRIKDIKNIQDNLMYMIAMFDINNQKRLADKLSNKAHLAIKERMIDGKAFEYSILFNKKKEFEFSPESEESQKGITPPKNTKNNVLCDNTDCKGNCKDIKPVEMKEEFEGEKVNWCKQRRKDDADFIKDENED